MKYILLAIILFTAEVTFAQKTIDINEAINKVGDTVTICTKIFGGRFMENSKGSPTLLNAGASYPNSPLTVVVTGEARKLFDFKPEEYYKDKSICVTGVIELYKEKPQIVVTKKSQIEEVVKITPNQ